MEEKLNSTEFRVLVCGGRDYGYEESERRFLNGKLEALYRAVRKGGHHLVIIHGAARGADSFAGSFVRRYRDNGDTNISEESYPADWNRYRKAAGHIRNSQMLEEGTPQLVLAFPGGTGTANMVKQAKNALIPVKEYG